MSFPQERSRKYTTLVCLACTFDIFTKQIGLAPRSAYSQIKHYTPTVEELTARQAVRPFFDSEESIRAVLTVMPLSVGTRVSTRIVLKAARPWTRRGES